MPREERRQLIEGRFVPEEGRDPLVERLDEELGGGLTDASLVVLNQLQDVAHVARKAAFSVTRTLPYDMRYGIMIPDMNLPGIFAEGVNLDVVAHIIATTDTVQELSRTAIEVMGKPVEQKEPFMAAVASGLPLKDHLGLIDRATRSKERTMSHLEILGIPPGFYEAAQVPAIRATLEYAQTLAQIWVTVYESMAKHFSSYLGNKEMSEVMMRIKDECQAARRQLVEVKEASEAAIEQDLPEIDRMGRKLLNGHQKMSGKKFLRLTEEYGEMADSLDLAILQRDQTTLDISLGLMRELQAVQATILSGKSSSDLLRLVVEEYMILYACELGVTTTYQSVAGLLMAAATGVRKAQRMLLTNETGYSLENDPAFLEKVREIQKILKTYHKLVRGSGFNLTDPGKISENTGAAEARLLQVIGENRRDRRDRGR